MNESAGCAALLEVEANRLRFEGGNCLMREADCLMLMGELPRKPITKLVYERSPSADKGGQLLEKRSQVLIKGGQLFDAIG
eukprot:1033739-Pelagomonas_calceolata.AAC.3